MKLNNIDVYKTHPQLLNILLIDRTTGHNIIFANDYYGHSFNDEIKASFILDNGHFIVPRSRKTQEAKDKRTKMQAEVFTPSWICRAQNALINREFFKDKEAPIKFDKEKKEVYIEYIKMNVLEITCGEAPYLTSRYDMADSNKKIRIKDRCGLLDRKLSYAVDLAENEEEFFTLAEAAYKATYAYEWAGDSLFLARQNLLLTFLDYYNEFRGKIKTYELPSLFPDTPNSKSKKGRGRSLIMPPYAITFKIASIISYNIFQMDGIKCVIPGSCHKEVYEDNALYSKEEMQKIHEKNKIEYGRECEGCRKGDLNKHNGIYAKVWDWQEGKAVLFKDLYKK